MKTARGRSAGMASAYEIAYRGGGRDRMIYAALAQLRAMGLIEATDDGLIRATAPLPHGAGAVERAVHAAIADRHVTRDQLFSAAEITAPFARARFRIGLIVGLIMTGVALGFGVLALRRLADLGWHEPVGIAMAVVAALAALPVPWLLRRRRTQLDPAPPGGSGRARTTTDQPALSVALYGPGVMWAIDREFAWRADIPPP